MSEPGSKLVIVGVDGSATAAKAAEVAADLARSLGARLQLVTALSSSHGRTISGPGADEFYVDDVTEMETELRSMATGIHDVEVDFSIEHGKPADVLDNPREERTKKFLGLVLER